MQTPPTESDLIDATQPRPVIRGTDIKVSQIASEVARSGMTQAEIIEAHPHLTLLQVRAALDYYEAHREQIREDWTRGADLVQQIQRLYPSRLPLHR